MAVAVAVAVNVAVTVAARYDTIYYTLYPMYSGVAPNCHALARSASIIVVLTTGKFEVFVMYSNSVHSFSTLRVKYFVTVATYGVITHLLKPALKGNQKGPR